MLILRTTRQADRFHVAQHEAGHAVAAYLFGAVPTGAIVHRTGDTYGRAMSGEPKDTKPMSAVARMCVLLAGDVSERWREWKSWDAQAELGTLSFMVGERWFHFSGDPSVSHDMNGVLELIDKNKGLLAVGFAGDRPYRETAGQYIARLIDYVRERLTPWWPCVDRMAEQLAKAGRLGMRDCVGIIRAHKPASVPFAFNVSEKKALSTAADAWLCEGIAGRLAS